VAIKACTIQSMSIVLLAKGNLPELCKHLRRHIAESGRDGDIVFSPRSASSVFDESEATKRHRAAWARRLDEPHWTRTWGLVENGAIVGHIDLHGGRIPSEAHRVTLGMGIERCARGRGNGRALLATVIAWGRDHQIAWIDLGVFAGNAAARALYTKVGFVEVGTTRDRFRVDGEQIDDVAMTLALGP
jgi:RimJ/RimL family protein N-acetyltransferase